MPEIQLPEVKLPDIKLPDGLREMNRDDIVKAARDVRMPKKIEMPDIDLKNVDLSKVELPDKVVDALPDSIADRLPQRRGPSPLIPLFALTIVGLAVVAMWWLFTSSTTGPRMRRAVDDLRSRMNGEPRDLVRYDDEGNLGSLVGQETGMSQPYTAEPYGKSSEMGYAGSTVGEKQPV